MPEWASFDSSYTNTPQEYAGWGAGLFIEPALKVTFADGNRDLVLHYESHTETADGVRCRAERYQARPSLSRSTTPWIPPAASSRARATIENREPQPVTIEQAAAAAWALPAGQYTLNYLTGRWAGEWNLTQEPLHPGARVIESRRGSTGHQANPWFAIQAGDPDEESWRSVVRRAGLERFLAHHRRAGPAGRSPRHRRLQSL